MPNRSDIQAFLKSIDLHGWAESAEHMAGVEKVVEALGRPVAGQKQVGAAVLRSFMNAGHDAAHECYVRMFAARFKGEYHNT